MSYTINEQNTERQQLLAQILNPAAISILQRAAIPPGGRCLDLGCGQGNTTRMLAGTLATSECIGLDFDSDLVAYASQQEGVSGGVRFLQGNAMDLDFPDNSFDVVFARYLLVHLPDPDAAIREILRVLKPGGKAIVYEPDFCYDFSDPDSWGMTRMTKVWQGMFAHPLIGRTLFRRFTALGVPVELGGELIFLAGAGPLRKIYRMTLEAMREGILARGIETEEEYAEHWRELARLENDPATVLYKFPDYWVVATKP